MSVVGGRRREQATSKTIDADGRISPSPPLRSAILSLCGVAGAQPRLHYRSPIELIAHPIGRSKLGYRYWVGRWGTDSHSTTMSQPIALLSVYDKTGLLPLAERLAGAGVRLLGSGGTAKKIREAGIQIECVDLSVSTTVH